MNLTSEKFAAATQPGIFLEHLSSYYVAAV